MHTSREEETSVDEAALVPSASKREKLLAQSTSRGETMFVSSSLQRQSASISTHQTTLVPYITEETAIHAAASRNHDISISERVLVPYTTATATPIQPPANQATSYRRHRKKMCSCCCRNKLCCRITIATFVVLVALLLFLIFYVFRARKTKIISHEVKVKNLTFSLEPASITLTLGINIYLKNPNYEGWKYKPSNTTLYYHGPEVGLATVPAGVINSRSRAAINISVDVDTTKMMNSKYLGDDLKSGYVPIDTYTVMRGKVMIIKIVKIHATVYMNCSVNITLVTWNTTTICKTKVHL